jgi:1-aminocyclopropane-1-carboxylate deaminase/D-cysteine desulfhydrase-like pyridoxal-dependent ACC family enzyme
VGEVRAGRVPTDDVAVFIHTGGLPIIFAYHEVLKNLD